MKGLDKRYYNIYFVGAVIAACFLFMAISTFTVFESIGKGKTSSDLALEKAKKTCLKQNGELVQENKNNPLDTKCVINTASK